MPVFDFSDKPVKNEDTVCTYTAFQSNAKEKTPEEPILVLDNSERQWIHHALGVFINPAKRTAFEFKENGETFSADILKIDSRFVSLIKWLGENHISVRLSGKIWKMDMQYTEFVRQHLVAEPSYLRQMDFYSL